MPDQIPKLSIVTGKGGVGKTTYAAALGKFFARRGLKVLLVETHGLSHLGELFGVGAVGYEAHKVGKNLSLLQITPESALKEYLIQQIHFEFIYKAVFNNRYVRHFLDAAPGLIELLTIGKIWYLVAGGKNFLKKSYDVVIVDAPATGHGLSLLTMPQVVVDAVKLGPLRSQSEKILNLLQDPEKTAVRLVTLAEEMPINEAIDMTGKLREAKLPLTSIAVNSLWPREVEPKALAELGGRCPNSSLLEIDARRREQSLFYLGKIREQLPEQRFFELPLIYEDSKPDAIAEALSWQIERQWTDD